MNLLNTEMKNLMNRMIFKSKASVNYIQYYILEVTFKIDDPKNSCIEYTIFPKYQKYFIADDYKLELKEKILENDNLVQLVTCNICFIVIIDIFVTFISKTF